MSTATTAAMAAATQDSGRIRARFAELAGAGRGGLVTFLTAGDPDLATSEEILMGLPARVCT